jgi:peroxiredoxin Q/BCP
VQLLTLLRVAATSAATVARGLFNASTGRVRRSTATLRVGDAAPAFAMTGSDGATYRLTDYEGRQAVVLVWFPKAFSSGCTVQFSSMGDRREAFEAFDVAVFGATRDDPETNRQFAISVGVQFPILSDSDGAVARAYGVLGASGFPSRQTFYIGLDGRILAIDAAGHTSSHGLDIVDTLARLNISPRTLTPRRAGRPALTS